ncbi:hypothetical protein GH810_15410 [Acetobacterium paludosum]|uniref:UspA domain-containing protein n=1 Tax=Acetobacterium paludosum TaxID=52693 RepID=A0A923HY11_9FIRM|nr:universal stress protein [Acetobacterium paludosum]MBC3889697.1 hypothetical protein [Acetobacterium paludosum]
MFSKIIIASERTPVANNILNYIASLRNSGMKECLLVQCLNPYETNVNITAYYASLFEENLERQKAILEEAGYQVETRIVSGLMKNEINQIAVDEDFDLIVVAAEEHFINGEIFSGGIAHEVIHKAGKPVLIVRLSDDTCERINRTKECGISSHILFPTDFSDNAKLAYGYVKELAEKSAKNVTIVHIQDHSKSLAHRIKGLEGVDKQKLEKFKNQLRFDTMDEEKLQELKQEVLLNKVNEERLAALKEEISGNAEVNVDLFFGSPTREILRLIKELKIPLVVMGSQGKGYIKEVFLGSVSHNIIEHSTASILLIPANREEV